MHFVFVNQDVVNFISLLKHAVNYLSCVVNYVKRSVFTLSLPFIPHHPITPIEASSPCLNPGSTAISSNLNLFFLSVHSFIGMVNLLINRGPPYRIYVNITKLSMMTF